MTPNNGQHGGRVSNGRITTRKSPYDKSPRNEAANKNNGDASTSSSRFEDHEGYEIPEFSLKVSGKDDCRAIAGKIAEGARLGNPPALLTIGNSSINQSVKGVAVARQQLGDTNLDLCFQPAFRDADRTRALIAFYVTLTDRKDAPYASEEVELCVSSQSKSAIVAGAIAARVREQKAVCLTAMGVDAVAICVLAVGNARCYLEQDNLDIRVMPEFEHAEKGGQTVTVMKMHLLAEKMED